jgi:hypothetical protein
VQLLVHIFFNFLTISFSFKIQKNILKNGEVSNVVPYNVKM